MLAWLIGATLHGAMRQPTLPVIIPKPAKIELLGGSFSVTRKTVITAPPEASTAAGMLRRLLQLGPVKDSDPVVGGINFRFDPAIKGSEAYTLTVSRSGIDIAARKPAGFFYAVQTLRQCLPAEVETKHRSEWSLPAVAIQDSPRFGWRGMHLDVSRHFFSVAEIKRYLDLMALHKFNVFHWHLVDDGGWRIEIKQYPLLTAIGGFRAQTKQWNQRDLKFGGAEPQYGGFYTQAEIKDVVRYAQARAITIVPEIEMPGHTMPSIAAYPDLACHGYDRKAYADRSGNQLANVYCAGREQTFEFIQNVLTEVMQLFPSEFIHVGGDEVDKFLWSKCPACQSRMKQEGLKDEQELQSYFIRRIEKFLNSKGRRLIGWDEILEGGLAPNAAVMSWRGVSGGIAAAKAGHDVVMSPTSPCYFDYGYDSNSVEAVYAWNPVPTELASGGSEHVLGGQANVWTEWIPNFRRVERMTFPRILSLAEVLWSNPEGRSFAEFQGRLGAYWARLNALGVQAYIPAPQLDETLVFLNGPTTWTPAANPYPALSCRYTLDGSRPTKASPLAAGPVRISGPCTLRVAYFDAGGVSGEVSSIAFVPIPASFAGPLAPGLVREVYDGKFDQVPDFAKLKPRASAYLAGLEAGDLLGKGNVYACRFYGVLVVPADAAYTFELTSDDGSRLILAGATLIANDGLHAPLAKTARVRLKAGAYPFEAAYFNALGGDAFSVRVAKDDGPLGPIPADWLRRPNASARLDVF